MMKMLGLVALLFAFHVPAHALEVGDTAPCTVLTHINVDGTDSEHCIRQPEVIGKPVVLEFFSVFCSDCEENLPKLGQLADQLAGIGTVRQVSVDRKEADVRKYVADNRQAVKFSVALDTEREATHKYGVTETPTMFVLDKNNKIIYKTVGVMSDADIANVVKLSRDADEQ